MDPEPPEELTDDELRQAIHEAVHGWQQLTGESEKRAKRRAAEKEKERIRTLKEEGRCLACDGAGWLRCHELLRYGRDPHDPCAYDDDTRHSCDRCGGTGLKKKEKETIPHQCGRQELGGCLPGCPHEDDPYA